MSHPNVVIVGAGSLFFGRKAIWQMVHSPHLRGGTLSLVDTDADRLDRMKRLAEKVAAHNQAPLTIKASTDVRDVLPGADFVVLSFAYRNAHFRGVDCELSAKYGIRMCSGDTIGPGGVFRSMRELPQILEVAKAVEDLAPEAWVINYINPTTVNGIALKRHFPNLKSFALCDAQYDLRRTFAILAGLVPDKESYTADTDKDLVLLTAGPNHFTFTLRAEYKGQDIVPAIAAGIQAKDQRIQEADASDPVYKGSKGHLNESIQHRLYETFGYIPTVVGHTKEYMRFWQGDSVTKKDPPLMLFDVPARVAWTDSVWKRVDDYLSGAVDIAEFDTEFGPDPATDIIESMWGGLGKRFFINTWNGGAVDNMADDAFIELYCDLDMNGPRPLPVGPMPRGIRGLMEQVLDTHELTVDAIVQKDRSLLRRALLTDPLTRSIGDTEALIEDLLNAERDALPDHWYQA